MAVYSGPEIPNSSLIYNFDAANTKNFALTSVEVLVVAGGGGGGGRHAGGGGGGGVTYNSSFSVTPGTSYTVTVGVGGQGASYGGRGGNGGTSIFGSNGNIITDPGFASGITGWGQYNSTLTWHNSNSLRATSTVASSVSGVIYYFSTVVGKTYLFKAEVSQSNQTGNDCRIQISGIGLIRSTGQSTTTATIPIFDYFTASATTHILEILSYNPAVNGTITIDNVELYNITDNLCMLGGGGGGGYDNGNPSVNGAYGASGGGGAAATGLAGGNGIGAAGLTGQGNAGATPVTFIDWAAGGGGGAGGPGEAPSGNIGGRGGPGLCFNISGTVTYYGGGGGGGGGSNIDANGGAGGLGGGGRGTGAYNPSQGIAGTPNTGGGGGGSRDQAGSTGGSGIVIVRYLGPQRASGGTVTRVGNDTVHTFTSVGSTTFTPFSTSSFTGLSDLSNVNSLATAINSPTYSSSNGGYINLNGSNQSFSINYSTAIDPTAGITIECWVYPTTITATIYYELYRKENSSARHLFSFQDTGTILSFGTSTTANGYHELDVGISAGDYVNQWVHLVASYTSGNKVIYRNGVAIGSTTAITGTLVQGSATHYIGSLFGSTEFFNGRYAVFRMYGVGLTANQILNLFETNRGRFGI